ncbi:unnamed protein product [Rotaria magnacalcarata]|uniref:Guanylate-binding protein N-terminal domain-containing protein n=3 Tax=Rotaria magnacalcarata TaxID=392030 RepID=A0A816FSR1_9BILA|nr:unnamed protein product [Rotaria magnacalcarata]CAF1665352.1 unnamed protein product [Rotaria magnacalcarata]CAF4261086.1 unnamed protein product [Rotaria magnacalcarata]
MSNQQIYGFIQLITCIPPTDQQSSDPAYIPQLTINPIATATLAEEFESPISIFVYIASLQKNDIDNLLLPFKSGDDPRGVTNGVWMWSEPLKDPNRKRGSILVLDCEGMGGNDVIVNNNLYSFCMIVSSVLTLVLRPARIDRDQCNRLHDELQRFVNMQSPCVLPHTYLVPLELPVLKCNDQEVNSDEWINRIFTINDPNNTLNTAQRDELQRKYHFIRTMMPSIDVVNLNYLPNELKSNNMTLRNMKNILRKQSSKDYNGSLLNMLKKFLETQQKRLPGSNVIPALLIRPAELALFMADLIHVINQARDPNPDELIGRCLLKRFSDEIIKTEAEFQEKFFAKVASYAKKKMWDLAKNRIYTSNSILLSSQSLQNCIEEAQVRLNSYRDPEELINKIRAIYNETTDEATQKIQSSALSEETKQKLQTLTERICRENNINKAIEKPELKCDVDRCEKCGRQAATISIVHKCSNIQQGNYYRYDEHQMVCDACRRLAKINVTTVNCAFCGASRIIRSFIN